MTEAEEPRQTKKGTSRFVAEAEDGIPIKTTRPITKEDEQEAADIWAEITGQKTDPGPDNK